jgi:hypothetical protein
MTVGVMAAAVVVLVHHLTLREFYWQDELTARQWRPMMAS